VVFTCPGISVGATFEAYEYIIWHFDCVFALELILHKYAHRLMTLCGIACSFSVFLKMTWQEGSWNTWNQMSVIEADDTRALFSAADWPIWIW
jgi:hypothetical protein